MATGFEPTTVDALVLYGYALEGLSFRQCERIEKAVSRLGSGLAAAPHGDLSSKGSPNASTPDGVCSFPFVVGALVARARTAAVEDATTQSAMITDPTQAKARAAFDAARPVLDAALVKESAKLPEDPGLYVVAAGPMATARLDADPGATIEEAPATGPLLDPVTRFEASSRGGLAPRVRLVGPITLSARHG